MAADVQFNLQTFLSEMREEMHAGFARTEAATAQVRNDLAAHELVDVRTAAEHSAELKRLSGFQNSINWALKTIVGAVIVAAIGALVAALR